MQSTLSPHLQAATALAAAEAADAAQHLLLQEAQRISRPLPRAILHTKETQRISQLIRQEAEPVQAKARQLREMVQVHAEATKPPEIAQVHAEATKRHSKVTKATRKRTRVGQDKSLKAMRQCRLKSKIQTHLQNRSRNSQEAIAAVDQVAKERRFHVSIDHVANLILLKKPLQKGFF
jgi:hypothetical protein